MHGEVLAAVQDALQDSSRGVRQAAARFVGRVAALGPYRRAVMQQMELWMLSPTSAQQRLCGLSGLVSLVFQDGPGVECLLDLLAEGEVRTRQLAVTAAHELLGRKGGARLLRQVGGTHISSLRFSRPFKTKPNHIACPLKTRPNPIA